MSNVLEQLISVDDSPYAFDEKTPQVEWYTAITDVAYGAGLSAATTCLEHQHETRNSFTLAKYRAVYGDGNRVTDFQTIEVKPLPKPQRDPLEAVGILDAETPLSVPQPPETDQALPVWVTTSADLRQAFQVLVAFPPQPSAAPSVSEEATSKDSESPTDASLEPGGESSDTTAGTTAVLERIMREVEPPDEGSRGS